MANNKVFFNPFTDFGFKKLFGEEGSKDLLLDFLNQLLPETRQVSSLSFMNSEKIPDLIDDRKAIFDIHCISTTGERFIVEMQKAKIDYFRDRALFYATFPIKEQAQKGNWDFYLEPVYLIAIQDFLLEESSERTRDIKIDVMLKDQHGDVFYDKLHFCFVQMPLFDKKEHELETQFDKWLFFLKNLENFDHIPGVLNEPVFQKGFEIARLANMKPKEVQEYNDNIKKYLDMMNIVETAKKDGGRQNAIKNAKEMIKDHLPIEQIMRYSGLTQQDVERLIEMEKLDEDAKKS